MTLQIILGLLLRHGLTALGGGAFVDGLLQGDIVNQIAGGIASAIGVGLSVLQKKK